LAFPLAVLCLCFRQPVWAIALEAHASSPLAPIHSAEEDRRCASKLCPLTCLRPGGGHCCRTGVAPPHGTKATATHSAALPHATHCLGPWCHSGVTLTHQPGDTLTVWGGRLPTRVRRCLWPNTPCKCHVCFSVSSHPGWPNAASWCCNTAASSAGAGIPCSH
jgi:hypothetical protein